MDAAGQSVSTNPLFNTTGASPLAASAKVANSSSNALNNKKFSDVLDKQQAADKVADANRSEHPASDSLSAGKLLKGVAEDVIEGTVEGFQVQTMALGGKPLPAEGVALPLMAETGAFNGTIITVNLSGEELTAITLQQTPQNSGPGQSVDAEAVVAIMPASNIQSFVVGDVAGGVGVVAFNAATADQAGSAGAVASLAAPLAGIQTMGQGRGQGNGAAFNASTTATHSATAALPTDFDMDVANKPVTGLVANSPATASPTTSPTLDMNNQLQTTLAQATPVTVAAFAVEPTNAGATTETASPLNTLLTTEAPQAFRTSGQASIQAAVAVEVGKPGWSDTVMERVMWMSSQQINKAEIALDPPELGPLRVRISTHGDQTTVSFTSQHGVVRDALDQGLPRLREMMDSQGLNLADVDVSDQHKQQQQSQANANNTGERATTDRNGNSDGVISDQETNTAQLSEMKPRSLIDQYV